jgi:septum site-determining protein MinD
MAARVITVTSGKGGVGKTTATANLSTALAAMGKRVICIDADIGLRNLDLILGLESRIIHDLVDVVEGRCRLADAIIRHKGHANLALIPAAQDRDKTAVAPDQMKKIVADLRPNFDFVIIDCPAGIERGFRNAIAPADEIVVVTNPEVSAVRDADKVIGQIEATRPDRPLVRLIINRVKADMIRRNEMLSADDVTEMLSVPLVGIVPDDEQVLIAGNRGEPNLTSKAGQAFNEIARRLNGEDVPLAGPESGGFRRRLARLFGGN